MPVWFEDGEHEDGEDGGWGQSVRCGWELSVLVYGLVYGLHVRKDGLEVGRVVRIGGTPGSCCGIADGVCGDAGCGLPGVACLCAVVARCGRAAGESNVWASDLDSGERLAAFCLCRMYAPPAAVSARGYGFGGGMRRCEDAAAGSGGGMRGCTTGSRDGLRHGACGCGAGRSFKVGLRLSAALGERYGRMAVRAGRADRWDA